MKVVDLIPTIQQSSLVQATWKSRGSNQFSPDSLRCGLRFSIVGFPTGRTVMKTCSVEGCNRRVIAKNLCNAHYQRVHKYGGLMADRPISKSRPGSLNSKWRGGQVTDNDGRVGIYSPDHPYPNLNGIYVYRYRLVVEKSIGRFLKPSEIVHHKNGDVSDDRLENLEYMTQSEHVKIHQSDMKNEKWRAKLDARNRTILGRYA